MIWRQKAEDAFSITFHDNSKNKNRKIYFSTDSAHCASSIKTGLKLRGGGVHILDQEKPLYQVFREKKFPLNYFFVKRILKILIIGSFSGGGDLQIVI